MFDGHWGRKERDNDKSRQRDRQKSAGYDKYVTRAIAIAIAQPEIRCFCAVASDTKHKMHSVTHCIHCIGHGQNLSPPKKKGESFTFYFLFVL